MKYEITYVKPGELTPRSFLFIEEVGENEDKYWEVHDGAPYSMCFREFGKALEYATDKCNAFLTQGLIKSYEVSLCE